MEKHRQSWVAMVMILLQVTSLGHCRKTLPAVDASISAAMDTLLLGLKNIEAQQNKTKDSLKNLARQVLLQRFAAEDRIRTEGDSGLVQVRYTNLGSNNYDHDSFVGRKSFMSIHDHSNSAYTVGMGEFVAVLNGVEFRTRHNDYKVVMPSRTSKDFHATEEIPMPPVPPSVLAQPDVQGQILEMREYFRAFQEQNITIRDYRPYFRPVLSYLEGAWMTSKGDIEESFDSDRHHLDANSWFDMQEKIRYTAAVGTKDPSENFADLPTSIIGIDEATGEPVYTQWNYRILGWPIDMEDLPVKYFKFVDDLMVRTSRGYTLDEAKKQRTAHFNFDEYDEPRITVGDTMLDKIIKTIPGKDNIPDFIGDDAFGAEAYDVGAKKLTKLNLGYYSHWFRTSEAGAMGTSVVLRGFSDANLYVAYTTQPRVAPLHFEHCVSKRVCNSVDTRVSYMIPLEVVYLTPLMSWNPYNLAFYSGKYCDNVKAASCDANIPITPNRNGRNSIEKAFNGTGYKVFYRTPSEFYEQIDDDGDPADTAQKGVFVLDQQGELRRCEASGYYILTPSIPGVGRVRLRYPIAPVHGYGNPIWKELNAFKDSFKNFINTKTAQTVTFQTGPSYGSFGSHTHMFILTGEQYREVKNGGTLQVETTEEHGHTHTLDLVYNSQKYRFQYTSCNGRGTCFDGHPNVLDILSNMADL